MFQAQCRHWYSELRSSQPGKIERDLGRQLPYSVINCGSKRHRVLGKPIRGHKKAFLRS